MGEPVADFELTAKTFYSVRKNEERNSEAESQLTRIWAVVAWACPREHEKKALTQHQTQQLSFAKHDLNYSHSHKGIAVLWEKVFVLAVTT